MNEMITVKALKAEGASRGLTNWFYERFGGKSVTACEVVGTASAEDEKCYAVWLAEHFDAALY